MQRVPGSRPARGQSKVILLHTDLMRNLLSPAKPGEKSFMDLVDLLKNHFNPKPSEIVQRFKFDSRMRKPIESVGKYVAELRTSIGL